MSARIPIDREKIAEFCRRHHIRKLALFGSVLRDDFRSDSDIDVLVEFEEGKTPGLAFFAMQDELSVLLDRRVDLNTPQCLSRYFRDKVLAEAEVVHVGA
jgi:predicted nucleotidyltransferase